MDSNGGYGTLQVVAASRLGAEHLRVARNNQDGLAWAGRGGRGVAVVTDGCSMAPSSEVGAVLAAAWIAERIASAAGPLSSPRELALLCEGLASDLDRAIERWSCGRPEVVARCFLFTFLAAVVDGDTAAVIGLGDGVYAAGGGVVVLDAGPDNAPDYAAYRVLGDDAFEGPRPPRSIARVHHVGPLAAGEAVVVATDGAAALAGELGGWARDPALWRSPRALERRLNQRARELLDDTTIIAVRRGGASCG